jgi:hypothetical protein
VQNELRKHEQLKDVRIGRPPRNRQDGKPKGKDAEPKKKEQKQSPKGGKKKRQMAEKQVCFDDLESGEASPMLGGNETTSV